MSDNNTIDGKWNALSGGRNNKFVVPEGLPTEPVDQNQCKDSAIVGGNGNQCQAVGAVVGGENNCVMGWANYSAVFGIGNIVEYSAGYSVALGDKNRIGRGSSWASITGGMQNTIDGKLEPGEFEKTGSGEGMHGGWIGGGRDNLMSGQAVLGVIGGGAENVVTGAIATVSGGKRNHAIGRGSMVPGGEDAKAIGQYSFAAGNAADALHDGSFVWGSDSGTPIQSERAGQMCLQAYGGIFVQDARGYKTRLHAGSGSWSMTTDSEAIKSNRTEVVVWDWLLDRLQKLPIYHFSYKAQPDIRHVGPLAQDFHKAFPWVGEDAETISTIDAIGVLFMAVKELTKIVREQAP